jgi:hypothetical protein
MSEETSVFNRPITGSEPALEDLVLGYRRLRLLFHCMAISLILLTGTVFIFLYRQVILVRRQTTQLERRLQYESSGNRQAIVDLRDKLAVFTRQNPDFAPIFNKYFSSNPPPPGIQNPVPQPAPKK